MEASDAVPAPAAGPGGHVDVAVDADADAGSGGSGPDSIFLLADASGLDLTALSNPDYKVDGSDSGVEAGSVRGATPAASCDSSLLSCCSDSDDPPPAPPSPGRRASPAASAASSTATRPARLFRGKGSPGGGAGSSGSGSSGDSRGRGRAARPASAASSASSGGAHPHHQRPRPQAASRARAAPAAGSSAAAAAARGSGRRGGGAASASARTTPVAAFGRCTSATPSRRDKANAAAAARRSATPTPAPTPTSATGSGPPSLGATKAGGAPPATSPRGQPPSLVGSTATCTAEARHVLATYATLPRRSRRRTQSPPAKIPSTASGRAQLVRSLSASRESSAGGSSLVRAASLRRPQSHTSSTPSRSLPPYPRPRVTRRVFSAPSGVTTVDAAAQTDSLPNAEEVRHLEAHIRLLTEGQAMQQAESERLTKLLQHEQSLRASHEEELTRTLNRVQALLGTERIDVDEGSDSLQELEMRVQTSDHIVLRQQREISELQALCTTLQRDLDKSLAAQKMLLQQQQDQEAESMELQEFLQAEKSTLAEALREAENEISRLSAGLQQSQEECKHLVRISEQRRQENMALQARLGGLGARSEELLVQQGAAVSGAAVQLLGLGSRLEALIDQLVATYNISEKDLEDVIFHNEAYSKSESSVEASPEHSRGKTPPQPTTSNAPQTTNGELPSIQPQSSFVAAVIGAIKSATGGGIAKRLSVCSEPGTDTDMENTVQNSVQIHNQHSSEANGRLVNSPSLQDLSQAILERQQSEGDSSGPNNRLPSAPALALVDQIVEADNLLTRLLKVLRIVQLDRDSGYTDTSDRSALLERLRHQEELTRNWETTSEQLRVELQRAHEDLAVCTRQLEKAQQLQQESWQEKQQLLRQWLTSAASREIPDLKPESLTGLAMQEVRRQYEVIDGALETLQGIQGVVMQCPSLAKLQQDLEETNFHCLTTLPLVGADVNANAAVLGSNRIA
ncbi:ribosome-binding protein 1 isoform X1 [Schistocerca gregaria]|uniref:ribosome-binding protein 1 isoform X1 n=1 Tax=Schistocerca gregaria TaxID=7010 RepID=UPI00211E1DE8|nr:ribosome-binding protein 1 isoform X1 [Schistocerca gregaria]XP_049830642.1 ribosome-binding protein 1 isoform X1 [Schistocerca gregaria]XP_049830650.1 ribosome-binding protein 1 isoform X1 [Schistocerca gregaria]XP_049830660.1 ribosome-binding protein 1 isoform X1 [Schistocerca gregaria]XP_049830668.1 ribosome-binding protein 1 isoform X1 [Schistocerca gregaria]XP_049830675.1 ribosome-binding protein 1 isoform X1 [Schistocerca gregaria]XP_049830683.1 ribosome-binding protein 1 isoform X1 